MSPKNRIIDHPGKILVEEFMKPLNLTGNALALELHVPASRISGIINGQRAVSADTALRLRAISTPRLNSGFTCRPDTT